VFLLAESDGQLKENSTDSQLDESTLMATSLALQHLQQKAATEGTAHCSTDSNVTKRKLPGTKCGFFSVKKRNIL
jgi:hypothetical protein